MVQKVKIIGPGKIDKTGWKKIGKSFLITLGGSVIGFVLDFLNVIDYGSYQSIAATVLPFISATLYKWLGKYKAE